MLGFRSIASNAIAAVRVPTAYSLTAEAGSYTLTGQTAGTRADRKIVAEAGTYSLTGQTAALFKGKLLVAEAGSYVLSGQDAALKIGRKLTAEAGAYVLTGQTADLILFREGQVTLSAAAAAFTVTGQTANLYVSRINGDEVDPVLELMYSEDGGATWSNPRQLAVGREGERRRRIKANRLGMSGEDGRIWRLRMSASVAKGITGMSLDVEKLDA
jgi:hypothetical protein